MGGCLSKKSTSTATPAAPPPKPPQKPVPPSTQLEKKNFDEEPVKREVFIIKHRKSHEIERRSEEEVPGVAEPGKVGPDNGGGAAAPVRTSSCTKEEVDAILIQCGRLSRSSSTGKGNFSGSGGSGENNGGSVQRGRRYSGSKRSFDFESEKNEDNGALDDKNGVVGEGSHRNRQRSRSRGAVGSPSKGGGRRRTPSREREQQGQQPRSGSRERGGGPGSNGSGRRVSRSPGRRSDSPITTSSGGSGTGMPGKLVSVPATVSSMALDKSTNDISASAVKRVQVKRNAGGDGARVAASPRARSPARANAKVLHENQPQPGSLSRSNSRKADVSPYRRNPLAEIDNNVVVAEQTKSSNQAPVQKPNADHAKVTSNMISNNAAAVNVARSRSSRLSRDLDINPEILSNTSPSYTALLLEDIHNFHQKSGNGTVGTNGNGNGNSSNITGVNGNGNSSNITGVSFPPCLSKANSILEAVADLNSSTGTKLSQIPAGDQFNKCYDNVSFGKKGLEKIEVDDIMQPSFEKYVTVSRGGAEDLDDQESSGSNTFVSGQQQHWLSPSSWEPNSAESVDNWTSSRRNVVEESNHSSSGFQRHAISELLAHHESGEAGKGLSGKKDQQQNGIGRGRIGSRAAVAAST